MSDLISRQDAIKACFDKRIANNYDIADLIEMLPSVELPIKEKCCVCPHCDNCDVNEDGTIERKNGEWKWVVDRDNENLFHCQCSICYSGGMEEYNYCPHCGAYMKGEDNG